MNHDDVQYECVLIWFFFKNKKLKKEKKKDLRDGRFEYEDDENQTRSTHLFFQF